MDCVRRARTSRTTPIVIMLNPISLRVTWLLSNHTNITPNDISLFRVAILFPLSAIFFLYPKPLTYILGAIIYQAAFISDLVDGELARLKCEKSLLGAIIDASSDRLYIISLISMLIGYLVFRVNTNLQDLFAYFIIASLLSYLYTKTFLRLLIMQASKHGINVEETSNTPFKKLDKILTEKFKSYGIRVWSVLGYGHVFQQPILFFLPLISPIIGISIPVIAGATYLLLVSILDIRKIKRIFKKIKDIDEEKHALRDTL